jgi:hypothetical protein
MPKAGYRLYDVHRMKDHRMDVSILVIHTLTGVLEPLMKPFLESSATFMFSELFLLPPLVRNLRDMGLSGIHYLYLSLFILNIPS